MQFNWGGHSGPKLVLVAACCRHTLPRSKRTCIEGGSCLPALSVLQIYRAEVWSKQLGAKSALPMLSMSLLMIAGISLASTAAAHPQATLHVLGSPGQALAALAERQ